MVCVDVERFKSCEESCTEVLHSAVQREDSFASESKRDWRRIHFIWEASRSELCNCKVSPHLSSLLTVVSWYVKVLFVGHMEYLGKKV